MGMRWNSKENEVDRKLRSEVEQCSGHSRGAPGCRAAGYCFGHAANGRYAKGGEGAQDCHDIEVLNIALMVKFAGFVSLLEFDTSMVYHHYPHSCHFGFTYNIGIYRRVPVSNQLCGVAWNIKSFPFVQ
jgi:hypothetical protein